MSSVCACRLVAYDCAIDGRVIGIPEKYVNTNPLTAWRRHLARLVEEHLKGFYTKNVLDIGAVLRIVCFGGGMGPWYVHPIYTSSATSILNLG